MGQLAAVIPADSSEICILHRCRLLNIRFRLVTSRLILKARVKLNEKRDEKQTNNPVYVSRFYEQRMAKMLHLRVEWLNCLDADPQNQRLTKILEHFEALA